MHLRIGAEHPRSLTIWPNESITTNGDKLSSSDSSSSSSVGISPNSSTSFPQVQETIMFSPDNTTTLSSSQGAHDSQAPSPAPSTQLPPPPAAPGIISSPVPPVTVTEIQPLSTNLPVDQPSQAPPPVVTTTVQSVSISESISISEVVSISKVTESADNHETPIANAQTVFISTTKIVDVAHSPTSSTHSSTETPPESSSSLDASSLPSSSAASSHALNRHGAPFYVGVCILCIAIVAILSTFVAWLIRARYRRNQRLRKMPMSWDPEKSSKGGIPTAVDAASLKDLESSQVVMSWNLSRERDAGEPKRSESFGTPFPLTSRLGAGEIGIVTPHLLPPHLRTPFNNMQDPPPLNPTTPEMNHTLGPLTVTNMMPGDVTLSGYEPSNFAQSVLGSDFGTPNEMMAGTVPRFLGLGSGLSVPWTPKPNSRETRQPKTSAQNIKALFHSQRDLPEPTHATESWRSSLKSNLESAFHAVVGANANSSRVKIKEDLLTPIRPRSVRQSMGSRGTGNMSRRSTISTIGYSLEEIGDGRGVVHVHSLYGRPPLSVTGATEHSRQFTARSGYSIPEEAEEKEYNSGSFLSTSSTYSGITSASGHRAVNVASLPPRLPSIPPVRALTLRAKVSDRGNGVAGRNNTTDEAWRRAFSGERHTKPIISMPRISRGSTLSTTSAMSRQSSLTDNDEKEARRILRMRRKRVIALSRSGVGRGTTRRPSVRRFASETSLSSGAG